MSNGELTTYERKDFDPFKAMEALDDELIIQELEGRIVDTWVYHFSQDGKEVWGLSKVGVDMAGREMAKMGEAIREEEISYMPDPTDANYMLFKALASRVILGKEGQEIYLEKAFGTKRQAICYFKEGQPSKNNPFWYEQGCMKALRNAKARLISDDVRAKIMTMAKEKGKVKETQGSKSPIQQPQSKSSKPEQTKLQEAKKGVKETLIDELALYVNNDAMEFKKVLKEITAFGENKGTIDIDKVSEKWAGSALGKLRERVKAETIEGCTENPETCDKSVYSEMGRAYCGGLDQSGCKHQKFENA